MPPAEGRRRFARIATAGVFFQGGAAAVDTGTNLASLADGLTLRDLTLLREGARARPAAADRPREGR